jgi:hypothetical protein
MEKPTNSCPKQELNPGPSVIQLVTSWGMYGGEKIIIQLLSIGVITKDQCVACCDEKQHYWSILFHEHKATGEKLLALKEQFPAITFLQNSFQLDGAPPQLSHNICAFPEREFPNRWIGRGDPIP